MGAVCHNLHALRSAESCTYISPSAVWDSYTISNVLWIPGEKIIYVHFQMRQQKLTKNGITYKWSNTWHVHWGLGSTNKSIIFLFICGYVYPDFIVYFVAQWVTTVDPSYSPLQYILGFYLLHNFISVANFLRFEMIPTFFARCQSIVASFYLSCLGLVFFKSLWRVLSEVSGKPSIAVVWIFRIHPIRLLKNCCMFVRHSFSLWKHC